MIAYSRFKLQWIICFLFIFTSCNIQNINTEVERWKKQAESVTIIRDNYGVPHIYGKSDAGAVFGLLYAQCEDDFNRVETNYITAMGRMAEVEGESQLYTDLRMKLYIDPVELKKEYEKSPAWLKKLMDAFADGINYYLFTHPEVTPKLLKRYEPWMALAFSEGSIGGDIEQISVQQLKNFYGNKKTEDIAKVSELIEEEPTGSNGFAIAPSLTVNGNALFLINPHTSFFFRSEVHMISEEGLNAYGAVTWGQFFVYQGFNEHCGWMHTSSRADAIDYYLETIIEKEGKYYYKHGNQLKPIIEKDITLHYKDGEQISSKTITAYYTHHGPIIREENGKWVSVALMVEHEKALKQSYLRSKAKSYEEFFKLMELKTNSSNNTVYADADGNIAYFHGNFMPKRNEKFDWNKPVDGSDPETDWKGLHDVNEMIHIFNPKNGWIQNCNSTPFTAAGDFSPIKEDYPSYMAPDAENYRGLHAVMVLKNQKDFTLEKLKDAAHDNYLTGFEKLLPTLMNTYDKLTNSNIKLKNELSEPIKLLRDWDYRYHLGSYHTSLAVYWGQELMQMARMENIPRSVSIFDFMFDGINEGKKLKALSLAVKRLEEDFGSWKIAWGEINRYQRINGEIRQPFNDKKHSLPVEFVSSLWGSLASFGARTYPGTKKMYGTSGNSFVAVVEFGKRIIAKSILIGGQSGDPNSPHFNDQALMFTNGEFKDVQFYKEDIIKVQKRKYHPGD